MNTKDKLKIGLCFMNIGEKYKQTTYWSRQNKISYCSRHGYDFIEDESILIKDKPIPWSKIPLLLKYIDNYDYLVWIDADILIMNVHTKIESFIQKFPVNIVCGCDWRMINTGVMIIKSCDFSKQFIKAIETNIYDPNEDKNERYLNWEQGSFINLYDKNFMNCKEHIVVTEPTEMNSYWFNYFPGHFVLHFAGVRGDLLQYLIRDYYPERLSSDDDNTFKTRMEWLAGPVRQHLEEKLNHEKKMEVKNLYSFRTLLEELRIYHYNIDNKIRIGNSYDGGYVIPNLKFNSLFSFSFSSDSTFDSDFINKFNIKHANIYNPTINQLTFSPPHKNVKFKKLGLFANNGFRLINNIDCVVQKLDDIISEVNFDLNTSLLKIDIEGDEFESILNCSNETLSKFSCIIVEFHWITQDDEIQKRIQCLKKINNLFHIIHLHINNHSPLQLKDDFYHVPDVIEVTYIRKDILLDSKLCNCKFPSLLDRPNHGLIPDIPLNFFPFQRYYFSLTSIPSRFEKLHDVIKSLNNQIIKPTKIFIHIPKFYKRFNLNIDKSKLSFLTDKFDNLVINMCETDFGPATKFLPLMFEKQIHDDDPVIIVDDDTIYDPYLSINLLKDSVRFPDSCVTAFGITHSAYFFNTNNWFCDFNSQSLKPCGFREKMEGFIDAFEAFKGTLLKKKFFKEDVFEFPVNDYCFSDDVWFSGHILKNGYTIFLSKFKNTSKFLQDNVDALSSNTEIRDTRMKNVATYFHEKYGIWKTEP